MTNTRALINRVREARKRAGLTQAELADRAGISRTAVTAIEGRRLAPSVGAALALADVLATTVEALFGSEDASDPTPEWAWSPRTANGPFWQADVGGRQWRYPAESFPMLTLLPDGIAADEPRPVAAGQTLVIACCDPAAGLLASEYARASGLRMLVLHRSSRQALELLQQGKVHLAGLHLATREEPDRNADLCRHVLGPTCQLLRMTRWQEGIAAAPGLRIRSVRGAMRSKMRWVGREPGSGARQCLDRLLGGRPAPRRVARNHRGVAEAVQSGWADAGVCVQLTSCEAGLDFLPVQDEAYDLCIPDALLDDHRIRALLQVVRSGHYRKLLGCLPGYDSSETGILAAVN